MLRPWLRILDPALDALLQAPNRRLELARALNFRGRHVDAAQILDEALKERREDGDLWFERLQALGDGSGTRLLEGFHQDLEALRDEHPGTASHRRNLGFVRLLVRRLEAAERALRQALDLDGQDTRTMELLALVALQKGEAAEAKGWLLKAVTLQPRDPRPLRLLGLAEEQLEDLKGAEQQFVAALELEPCYFWAWHSLGELLLRKGDLERGLECIHRARSLCVGDAASHFVLAELFSEQGHLELAQAELHTLLALAPPASIMAEAQGLLGELRRDLGDRDGAASYFTLAAETDPMAPNPWVALGDLAREDERPQDALRFYTEALRRDPEAADVHVQVGYLLMKEENFQEAEACFRSALQTDAGEYSAYLGLSEICRHNQMHAEQMEMVREALALAPDDADVQNALGVAHEVLGDGKQAEVAYQRALELDPQHRRAANNLGFLLEKRMQQGEPELKDRAIEAWRRRLLVCRDEGLSIKMAREHLAKLGVEDATVHTWLERDSVLS